MLIRFGLNFDFAKKILFLNIFVPYNIFSACVKIYDKLTFTGGEGYFIYISGIKIYSMAENGNLRLIRLLFLR